MNVIVIEYWDLLSYLTAALAALSFGISCRMTVTRRRQVRKWMDRADVAEATLAGLGFYRDDQGHFRKKHDPLAQFRTQP